MSSLSPATQHSPLNVPFNKGMIHILIPTVITALVDILQAFGMSAEASLLCGARMPQQVTPRRHDSPIHQAEQAANLDADLPVFHFSSPCWPRDGPSAAALRAVRVPK